MNNIFKLLRYSFSHKNFLQLIKHEIFSSYIQEINLPRLRSIGTYNICCSKKLLNNKLLSVSILTWLGFKKSEEDVESELIMTIKRAILLSQRGELPKAEQMLHIALRLAQEQQNNDGILYVYDIMANVALERGELDKAETLFLNVLQRLLSEGTSPDDVKVIHISLKLARIYHMKGDVERAEIGFKWCLDELKKNRQDDVNVRALHGIIQDWYAKLLLEKGQYSESFKYLKDAYKICCEIEGNRSEKSVLLLNDLGIAAWKMGNYINALEYLQEAAKIGQQIEDFDFLGVIYANLGLVYLQNGIIAEAKRYCREGWKIGRKYKSTDAIEQANYCFEEIKKSS